MASQSCRCLDEGDLAKAEKHARTSFEIHKKLYKIDHSAKRRSAEVLAEICTKADRPEDATRWRRRITACCRDGARAPRTRDRGWNRMTVTS